MAMAMKNSHELLVLAGIVIRAPSPRRRRRRHSRPEIAGALARRPAGEARTTSTGRGLPAPASRGEFTAGRVMRVGGQLGPETDSLAPQSVLGNGGYGPARWSAGHDAKDAIKLVCSNEYLRHKSACRCTLKGLDAAVGLKSRGEARRILSVPSSAPSRL